MEILGWVFIAILAAIGLIAIGLGLRSVPDARRYLKIRHM
ncbi:DUF6893 family small protein [Mycobacterium celatum]|uniref:Uncharacterized protein n=1 Tax=Mycobacterium celatum TaxID=28045 RepID=A0A2G5PKW0_MYCCE|nr:hypothetical protein CQY23_10950 [Mycobacterium celatum]